MTTDGPLDVLALAAVEAASGAWPQQPDRSRKTYVVRNGKRLHLRTYDGASDDWFFGIHERCWNPHEYFVFVCGGENAMFVVPVRDLPDREVFPPRGNDRLVHIDCDYRTWYIRDPNPWFMLDNYRDAFHMLV